MSVGLRPSSLDEIIGNDNIKETLKITIEAAKEEKRPVPHQIFEGHTGCGKTTFARAIGKAQNGNFYETNAAGITSHVDLLNYFVRLKENDVLFIDEIHVLPKKLEEFSYPVMEDFEYSINLEDVPLLSQLNLKFEESSTVSKFLRLKVPPFTLIGATTSIGGISSPLLDRFKGRHQLNPYSDSDIEKILRRSAGLLKVQLTDDAFVNLSKRCKSVPRIANSRIEWLRDYSLSIRKQRLKPKDIEEGKLATLTVEDVNKAMSMIDIDEDGLNNHDRQYLAAVDEMQPIGIQSLAARTGFTIETIQKEIEPYLLRCGKIKVTSGGRVTADYEEDFEDALKSFSLI